MIAGKLKALFHQSDPFWAVKGSGRRERSSNPGWLVDVSTAVSVQEILSTRKSKETTNLRCFPATTPLHHASSC